MSYLTIEFTGRITADDAEIAERCQKAAEVIAAAGMTVEAAWSANLASIEDHMQISDLWSRAELAATDGLGEHTSLVLR